MFDWIRQIVGGSGHHPVELNTECPQELKGLASSDWYKRWSAVEELRKSGPDAIETLLAVLEDPHFDVRRNAASTLLDLGYDPASLFQRIKAWHTTPSWRENLDRDRIAKYLDLLHQAGGKQAIAVLTELLQYRDDDEHFSAEVQGNALLVLGRITDPSTMASVVSKLGDTNRHVRLSAAHAMRAFIPLASEESLAMLLAHANKHVQNSAAYALMGVNWHPEDSSVRLLYAKAIADQMNWDRSSIGPQKETIEQAHLAIVPILVSMVNDGAPEVAELFSTVLNRLINCYSREGWDAFPFVDSAAKTIVALLQNASSKITTEHLHVVLFLNDRQFKFSDHGDGIDQLTVRISQVQEIIHRELTRRNQD